MPSGPDRLGRHRWFWIALVAMITLLYSFGVFNVVGWSGDIGLRCVFGTLVKDAVPEDYEVERRTVLASGIR